MAQTTITDFGASDADQEPSQDTSVDPTDFHREIPEDEFAHIGNGIIKSKENTCGFSRRMNPTIHYTNPRSMAVLSF